jgi:hypothetical protein
MPQADIEVVMRMSLQEAIDLRDDLAKLPITAKTTPHYEALEAQIQYALRLTKSAA